VLGDSVRRRQPGGGKNTGKPRVMSSPAPRRSIRWRTVIPLTLAALLIPFAVGYAFTVFVLFPAPKVEGVGGIAVPDLIGRTTIDAEQLLASLNLGELETMKLPRADVAAGTILAQDPLPGQQLKAGTKVSVSVSAGAPEVRVPDVAGFTFEAADAVMRKMGFNTTRIDETSAYVSRGSVIRVQPSSGTMIRLPSTIMMVISAGAPASDSITVSPDTIMPMRLEPR
jgi:hypothetical protein